MKQLFYFIAAITCMVACKKDPDPVIDYCADEVSNFQDHIHYEGEISFCNAQPPLQAFIPGVVTAIFLDSNTVSFHLVADSIHFDTTLVYDFQCAVYEQDTPLISFEGPTDNDIGNFIDGDLNLDYTGFIYLKFGYTDCLTNTSFEGFGKKWSGATQNGDYVAFPPLSCRFYTQYFSSTPILLFKVKNEPNFLHSIPKILGG